MKISLPLIDIILLCLAITFFCDPRELGYAAGRVVDSYNSVVSVCPIEQEEK